MTIAKIVTQTLTDGSEVYNVEIRQTTSNIKNGVVLCVIAAEDYLSADDIETAINSGASWADSALATRKAEA